jgi:hypothetical protein
MSESDVRDTNGRFVKGHPGGPGRPRNPVNAAISDFDRLGMDAAERLINAVVEQALKGNVKAAELVLRRVWPVRRNRPIEIPYMNDVDVPYMIAEHARLVASMMEGEVSAQDAHAAARVFKSLQEQMKAAENLRPIPISADSKER